MSIQTTRPDGERDIACPTCGAVAQPRISPGLGPHPFRAECRNCGHFIKWLSLYSPAEREARRQQARQRAMATRPPSAKQLNYLTVLGYSGSPPATMASASERIDALKRGEGEG
jgi:hypothetical protein